MQARSELEQLAMDLEGAPQRVLKTHSSDQVAHLFGDPRPSTINPTQMQSTTRCALLQDIELMPQYQDFGFQPPA